MNEKSGDRRATRGWQSFLPSTVVGQLIGCTVVLQLMVLGAFLSTLVHVEVKSARERDYKRVEMQAGLLAGLAADPISRNDRAEVARLVEAMRSSTGVATARITDLTGETIAVNHAGVRQIDSVERSALARMIRDGNADGINRGSVASHEGFDPIVVNGKPVAAAFIVPDPTATRRVLNEAIRSAVLYALCALLADVFLIMLLGTSIARPLQRLGQATKQVIRDPESTSGFPLPITSRNEAGQLTHSFNGMVREMQQQRAGLNETLSLLDSMLENAPVGFAFFDRRHRYVRANHFLEQMYGRAMGEHFGKTMGEIFPGSLANEVDVMVEQVFNTGTGVHDHELSGMLGDDGGEKRTWICNFYPVLTVHARVRWVGLVMTEVTNRVRSEEAMRKSEKLAAAGRLAASIAHEINNPLESVTNLLYLIRQHASLDAEAIEYASLAQRELMRVSEITQQTLRFYRSSTKPEMVQMGEIIHSVLSLHGARIAAANVRVEKRMGRDLELFGFAGELRQVMANLVGNAVDAMPRGGVLRVRIGRAHMGDVAGISVVVADNGIGMSEEVRRRIFEPFYTTKEATGTGLGLWVSDEIIAKHGGRMRVRSRQAIPSQTASGTVFRIFFPIDGARPRTEIAAV